MSLKSILPLLCAGLSLTAPSFAAPKPPAPPAHTTAAADSTSAVAAVSNLLTLRAKNNFAGMYELLSASSKKNIPRKEFVAASTESKAEMAQMPPNLRGMYALFADTRNVLGYTFAVVGPDPTNPNIVLVHAFPKPAPGAATETLKVYTVADKSVEKGAGKTSRRTVDAFGSVGRAMLKAQTEQAAPPADTPPAETPPVVTLPVPVPPADPPAAP